MTDRAAKTHAFWLFFPAASLFAALAVPLSVWSVWSGTGWPPGLTGTGHGHELIFGFALALVAGYTLGPQPRPLLYTLFGLWLTARLSWALWPHSLLAGLLSPAFTLALAWIVVPRFQAAKKWRNRIVGPLILVLCLMPLGFRLATDPPPWVPGLLPGALGLMHAAVLGLLLLMTFMGGRIIAPAVAGTLEKKGIPLEARVQPRLEAALIVLLAAAVFLVALPATAGLAGGLLVLSSGLIVVRTWRWKLWLCPERPDLLMFGLGYLWLATGALFTGSALLAGLSVAPSVHLITVGALGVLSTSVMLRLAWQRSERTAPPSREVVSVAGLVSLAAVARFFAGAFPFSEPSLLWLSAVLWSAAYGWTAWSIMRLDARTRYRRK